MRHPCDECGLPIGAAELAELDGRRLCPRCFALSTPATGLERGPLAEAVPSPAPAASAPPGTTRADPGDGAAGTAPRTALHRLAASIRAWAAGRNWWMRAPVLAWMAWILVRYWDAPWYRTIFAGIDLAFHEIGHYIWSPLGDLMTAAGGTLTQCLVPVAAGAVLYRQRDWFGVAIAACWLGINCFEVVEYAGDAAARRLPLVSPGAGEPIHDWWFMLSRLGILHLHDQVATAWQNAGRLIMTGGVAFGCWVLWLMATTPAREPGAEGSRSRGLELT